MVKASELERELKEATEQYEEARAAVIANPNAQNTERLREARLNLEIVLDMQWNDLNGRGATVDYGQ